MPEQPAPTYRPSKEEEEARTEVYADIQRMIDVKDEKYKQLAGENGNRNVREYLDDSRRRLNGHTLSHEAQGKDDWQANVFDGTTRTKLKAIIASVALQVPELKWEAVNKDGVMSTKRAEVAKQLVRHSRQVNNPMLDIFFEAWQGAADGTTIKYDGYLKTRYKRKFITSVDLQTGEVEFDEREETVDNRPIEIQVPLEEFFWWDMYIPDVQDQPKIAWIQKYNKDQLEAEFGKYKNFKFVKDGQGIKRFQSDVTSYFYDRWGHRVTDEEEYEVIRYFNKLDDRYEIWVNGVPLLRAPLLWGKAKKLYPFAKTIFEPFEGRNFFLGKSFPSIIEGLQDVQNTILNSILDKLYRSLEQPMLVGLANKDLLNTEDELVNQDNKIYVPDVNQVKPMPLEGPSNGDIAMMQLVSGLIDLNSIGVNQQGQQGKGVTAREALIADERARQLKGMFFMFLEDLWIQKTEIRLQNIFMHYMQPQVEAVTGKNGKKILRDTLTIFNVSDTEFSDGTRGTLGIQVARNRNQQLSREQIEAREDAAEEQGIPYKLISVTSNYLDDWNFDFQIISRSIFNQDRIRKEAEVMQKLQTMATLFPERLVANKDKAFDEFLDIYGESAEEYEEPQQQQPQPEGESLLGLGQQNAPVQQQSQSS